MSRICIDQYNEGVLVYTHQKTGRMITASCIHYGAIGLAAGNRPQQHRPDHMQVRAQCSFPDTGSESSHHAVHNIVPLYGKPVLYSPQIPASLLPDDPAEKRSYPSVPGSQALRLSFPRSPQRRFFPFRHPLSQAPQHREKSHRHGYCPAAL